MKKYVIVSLLALVMLCFSGCETHNSEQCKFHSLSKYLAVDSHEWTYDEKGMQYYAHFSIPELTSAIYNYGNYSLHRVYNTNTADEYQVALPQSIYMLETVKDATGKDAEYYYTQSVDYRVGIGFVEIQVTNSDYLYEEDAQGYLVPPEHMDFHLQLIW